MIYCGTQAPRYFSVDGMSYLLPWLRGWEGPWEGPSPIKRTLTSQLELRIYVLLVDAAFSREGHSLHRQSPNEKKFANLVPPSPFHPLTQQS